MTSVTCTSSERSTRASLSEISGGTVSSPEISLRLARVLRSEDVQVTLVKGGDHRLSRESDIALLLRTVAALTEGPTP